MAEVASIVWAVAAFASVGFICNCVLNVTQMKIAHAERKAVVLEEAEASKLRADVEAMRSELRQVRTSQTMSAVGRR